MLTYVELKETKEQALARLAKLVIDENTMERFESCGYYEWESEEFTPEIAEDMRKKLANVIEIVYSSDYRRDTQVITLDGNRNLIFTGGMSWGDDPSDVYTDFFIFSDFFGYPSWAYPDSVEVKEWEAGK